MTPLTQFVLALHDRLLCLYPRSFRSDFEEEMQVVFADAVAEATECGEKALLVVCLLELKDWPGSLLREYWSNLRERIVEDMMSETISGNDTPGLVPRHWNPVTRFVGTITAKNPIISRVIDIVFAILGLVVAAPLFAVLVVLV